MPADAKPVTLRPITAETVMPLRVLPSLALSYVGRLDGSEVVRELPLR